MGRHLLANLWTVKKRWNKSKSSQKDNISHNGRNDSIKREEYCYNTRTKNHAVIPPFSSYHFYWISAIVLIYWKEYWFYLPYREIDHANDTENYDDHPTNLTVKFNPVVINHILSPPIAHIKIWNVYKYIKKQQSQIYQRLIQIHRNNHL